MLTVEEVRRLIEAVRTPHNKAYFWTVYSLGLRLQEACTCRSATSTAGGCWCTCTAARGPRTAMCRCPQTLEVLARIGLTHRHPVWLFPAHGGDPEAATATNR